MIGIFHAYPLVGFTIEEMMHSIAMENQIRESLSASIALAKETTEKITFPLEGIGEVIVEPWQVTIDDLHGKLTTVTKANLEGRIFELNLNYNWKPELVFL